MIFIVESSKVQIYNRIATAFTRTLMEFGHIVHLIDASDFNEIDFINTLNGIEYDYYISTNELNTVQRKSEYDAVFLFEKLIRKIIFIHHDNLFSAFHSISFIAEKLKAYAHIKNRSHHFCLEESNVDLLQNSSIKNSFKINHASEFTPLPTPSICEWGVTFIGHLMSSLNLYPTAGVQAGQHLEVMAWNRFSSSSFAIQPQIKRLVEDPYILASLGTEATQNLLATQQFLIACLNKFSSPMRGQLISTIKKYRVDIFGGDLSYGQINDPLLILQQSNVHYQPATQNYQDARGIYASSRINLNISSLQFDTAINNRVFDVILSGGFILTDKRNDLEKIFPFHLDISYETPEEMNEKIHFWNNESSNYRYLEIKNEMQNICKNLFTYRNSVARIFSLIS